MTFRLDTSGTVNALPGQHIAVNGQLYLGVGWGMLPAVAQGYATEILRSVYQMQYDAAMKLDHVTQRDDKGFRHFAPETLKQIVDDSAEMARRSGMRRDDSAKLGMQVGAAWWLSRQLGESRDAAGYKGFAPLTPYIGDDGLIRFRPKVDSRPVLTPWTDADYEF